MGDWAAAVLRECALFACVGLLLGGVDDLAIDLIWAGRTAWRRLAVYTRHARADAATLPPAMPGRIALFVPAWREAEVIGAMVATARARLRHHDWRLYVGCYPNDPATAAVATRAAAGDPRIRIVVGRKPGPTTKADNLNAMWRAMLDDERYERRYVKAVVLHDAEDAVHRDELAVYDALIDRFDMVQIPVEPVIVRGRGWWHAFVSAHYCGEFAEAHGKQVVVREAVGAAVPSAGTGCAIARGALSRAAAGRHGPFDGSTLTEDYELGLRIGAAGGRGAFVRLPAADGDGIVAVRACFPDTVKTAVMQKGRWIAGIALAGWDRLGWEGGLAERWMRLRDRRAPLSALVTATAYLSLFLWLALWVVSKLSGSAAPDMGLPDWALRATLALLCWRAAIRASFTVRLYGPGWALATLPHMFLGNVVAMLAAGRAVGLYMGIVRSGRVRWDKTAHVFPDAGA